MRGHCSNASTLPGGSPTFSTRRDSRRRPLIRSAGCVPLVPINVGAIPTRIIADASAACVSGAWGSRPSKSRSASGVPAASVQARNSRGPGSHSGGTVLTAPRVQSRAMANSRGSAVVRTSGVFSSVRAISGCSPASSIISARASARHSRSTTTDSRAAWSFPNPTITTWPGAASIPVRSATAGGTDSAEKNDSWLTQTTLGQYRAGPLSAGRTRADKRKPPAGPAWTVRGVVRFVCLDGPNAGCLRALGALTDLELDLLVLLKSPEAGTLNFRVVDKNVGGAVLGSDKAEALLRVEPLHSSLWHLSIFPSLLTGCGPPTSGAPGPFRPPYLRGVVGTRPDLQLAGTALATSILRVHIHEHRSCDRP